MSPDKSRIYGMVTNWPDSTITLASINVTEATQISILGEGKSLAWKETQDGVAITLPHLDEVKSKWVQTLVIS